jgi:ubiquinone/menaquinone biosynthesis C-methylase UbiE
MRKPTQGILNIFKFNWHFYLFAIAFTLGLCVLATFFPSNIRPFLYLACALSLMIMLTSILVSFYIYDLSGLYKFEWLDLQQISRASTVLNITAGFDESSETLRTRIKHDKFIVLDFYDPLKHTEVSIKRARRAYPPDPQIVPIHSQEIPFKNESVDFIFLIFSAHEIRDDAERNQFFKEIHRVLLSHGQVIIVEHLRDLKNFLAYNIGYFHFFSEATWRKTFTNTNLHIVSTSHHTPFIKVFTLKKI